MGNTVYAIERIEELVAQSTVQLQKLGYRSVFVRHADGTLGWVEQAPFDAILVSAGAPRVPEALKKQLVIGGRMVIPLGKNIHTQSLILVRRINENKYTQKQLSAVRFVPLIGEQGWEIETTSP